MGLRPEVLTGSSVGEEHGQRQEQAMQKNAFQGLAEQTFDFGEAVSQGISVEVKALRGTSMVSVA